jgi:hypothetical protein
MLSLYRALLMLYPAAFRSEFGAEMISVFLTSYRERCAGSSWQRGLFFLRELTGLIHGALQEHSRSLFAFHRWIPLPSQLPLRRFVMPSQFRFPKSTAVLMTIILAGVVLAIEKGEAIEASLPHTNPPIAPIQPEHLTLLPTLATMFLAVYAAAVLAWIVLFWVRRTGMHRLAEMPSTPAQNK